MIFEDTVLDVKRIYQKRGVRKKFQTFQYLQHFTFFFNCHNSLKLHEEFVYFLLNKIPRAKVIWPFSGRARSSESTTELYQALYFYYKQLAVALRDILGEVGTVYCPSVALWHSSHANVLLYLRSQVPRAINCVLEKSREWNENVGEYFMLCYKIILFSIKYIL